MNKTLSVILFADTTEYLNVTVDSLLAQTHESVQIIVVSPVDNENCRSVLAHYNLTNITLLPVLSGEFTSTVVRRAILSLDAPYVATITVGSILSPAWASNSISLLENSPASVRGVFANTATLNEYGQIINKPDFMRGFADVLCLEAILLHKPVVAPAIFRGSWKECLLPKTTTAPYPALVAEEPLAGVRLTSAHSTVEVQYAADFSKSLIPVLLRKEADSIERANPALRQTYLGLHLDFIRFLLYKGKVFSAIRLICRWLLAPGYRKYFIRHANQLVLKRAGTR